MSYQPHTGDNIFGADLWAANLTGAKLTNTNLTGANLMDANIDDVRWESHDDRYLTILPDNNKWTPDTKMEYFSNPNENLTAKINVIRSNFGLDPIPT